MGFDAWILVGLGLLAAGTLWRSGRRRVGGALGRLRRGLGAGWTRWKRWALDGDSERPVLPSHYSSLLYTDPTSYPGHCPACGTDNEPRYQYCADCGAELPTPGEFGDPEDLRAIFGE